MKQAALELWVVHRRMAMQQRTIIIRVFTDYEKAVKFKYDHQKSNRCEVVRYVPEPGFKEDE